MYFSALHSHFLLGFGFALFAVGFLWLVQRLSEGFGSGLIGQRYVERALDGSQVTTLYVMFVLPVIIFPFFLVRGYDLGVLPLFGGLTSLVLTYLVGILGLVVTLSNSGSGRRGAFFIEQVGTILFLQLAWLFFLQSRSVLAIVLWLEILGLLVLLLLGFFGLEASMRGSALSSWRSKYTEMTAWHGLLTALLLLLWVNGLSTVVVVWSWGVLSSVIDTTHSASLNLDLGTLVLHRNLKLFGVGGLFFALGFFFKLMLQPFHFFLFSFYKFLPLRAFAQYLIFYYIFLVFGGVFFFLRVLNVIIAPWVLLVSAVLVVIFLVLWGGFETLSDVQGTLALSTALNLVFIICALFCIN